MSLDTGQLRAHLLARLAPLLAAVRAAVGDDREAVSDERAVLLVEAAVLRLVRVLVPEPAVQQVVIDQARLARGWSLGQVRRATEAGPLELRLLEELALAELRQGGEGAMAWPSEVAPADMASLLRRVGEPDAERLAQALLDGSLLPGLEPRRFSQDGVVWPELDKELGQALGRYPLSVCGLLVSVEQEARTAIAVETSALSAARFAFALVAELTRDEPEAVAKRRQILLDALSKLPADQISSVASGPDDPRLLELLDQELRLGVEELRAEAGFSQEPPSNEASARLVEEGILAWDERLARYLQRLGKEGERAASSVRQNAAVRQREASAERPGKLWALWADPNTTPAGCRFARLLTRVLWHERALPRLERARKNPPALVMAVHEPVVHLLSRTRTESQVSDGQRSLLLPGGEIVKVSLVDADTLDAIFVRRGIELFGSITAHRLLRWEVITAHRQALEGCPDPRVLTVEGGYQALARDVLGLKAKVAKEQVHAIIEAQHACEIPLPPHGDYSRLLLRRFQAAAGHRRARLELVLGTALLPNYVRELQAALGHKLGSARATRLVPVLALPPFLGRERDHGAQATLSMLVVAHIRDHARDLLEQGGVPIDPAILAELGQRAAVPPSTLAALLERWARDGDDGPAFLKRSSPGRYTLGDAHHNERAFIEEGARRELEGSQAGQKSANRKRARLQRLGRR